METTTRLIEIEGGFRAIVRVQVCPRWSECPASGPDRIRVYGQDLSFNIGADLARLPTEEEGAAIFSAVETAMRGFRESLLREIDQAVSKALPVKGGG